MFGDMMGKLQDMKQQMDQTKARLDNITVDASSDRDEIKVTISGNRKIKDISIDPVLLSQDKEMLEDLLVLTLNKAIEKADKVNEAEMQGAASGMMPDLKNMFGK